MKLWIVIPDYRYEGYGPPDSVWDSEQAAEARVKKIKTRNDDYDIIEMDVNDGMLL